MLQNKKRTALLAGIACVGMIVCAVIPASAAAGQIEYNQVGIRTFGEQRVAVGETYTAPNGQKVPSTITFIDAAGGMTNYLSVRQIGELLDATVGWNAQENSVDIAAPKTGGEIIISTDEEKDEERPGVSAKPEYGQIVGGLEEIDPSTVSDIINNQTFRTRNYARDLRVQFLHSDFPGFTMECLDYAGPYVVFSVTNNGPRTVYSEVRRFVTIAASGHEDFASVAIPSGETLTRVFRLLDDAHPLQRTLHFDIDAPVDLDSKENDITISLLQYDDTLD